MTDRCDILACSIADQNEDHDYDILYFSDANEDARIAISTLSGRRNSGGVFQYASSIKRHRRRLHFQRFLIGMHPRRYAEIFQHVLYDHFLFECFPHIGVRSLKSGLMQLRADHILGRGTRSRGDIYKHVNLLDTDRTTCRPLLVQACAYEGMP